MSLPINRILTRRFPSRAVLTVLLVLFGLSIHFFVTPTGSDMMPTRVGTYWIYDTVTREQVEGGAVQMVRTKNKITLVDSVKGRGVDAGLIEHKDLSNREPASFSIRLVFDNSRLYEYDVTDQDKVNSWRTLKTLIVAGKTPANPDESSLLMSLPGEVGSKWDLEGSPDRTDNMYCWCVETKRSIPASTEVAGISLTQNTTEYTIAFRTCPDHQIKRFIPGIGFTNQQYRHHGTISEVDERLIEFHPGS